MVSGDPKVQPGDKVLKGKTNVVAAMLSRGRQAGTALILQQELTKPCKLKWKQSGFECSIKTKILLRLYKQ